MRIKLLKKRSFYWLVCAVAGFVIFEVFSFCTSKKVSCPAFTDARTISWFPYTEGQQLIFKTSGNIADTFTTGKVDKTEAYEYTQGWYGSRGGCSAHYSVNFLDKTPASVFPFYMSANTHESFPQANPVFAYVYAYNTTHFSGYITDTGLSKLSVDGNFLSQYYPSLSFNGTTYAEVQELQRTSSGNEVLKIDLIYIARNKGIIAYKRTGNPDLFIKQ